MLNILMVYPRRMLGYTWPNKRSSLVFVTAATSRASLEILIVKSIGNTDDSLVGWL